MVQAFPAHIFTTLPPSGSMADHTDTIRLPNLYLHARLKGRKAGVALLRQRRKRTRDWNANAQRANPRL